MLRTPLRRLLPAGSFPAAAAGRRLPIDRLKGLRPGQSAIKVRSIEDLLASLVAPSHCERVVQGVIEGVPDIRIVAADFASYRLFVPRLGICDPLQQIGQLVFACPGSNTTRSSMPCEVCPEDDSSVEPPVEANQPGFGGVPVRGCCAGSHFAVSPRASRMSASSASMSSRASRPGRSEIFKWTAAIRARLSFGMQF